MDIEIIKKNWATYKTILSRLEDENINNMLEEIGARICVAPANSNNKQYGCYPGGIVVTSTKLAKAMQKLNEFHGGTVNIKSVYKIGLLHDIGRLGTIEADWLLAQDSDWHREKLGQMYRYNEEIQKMSISHRSLFLLQNFGVKISEEEWIAIQLSQGSHFEENRFYARSEPTLALILQQAKSLSIHKS